MEIWPLADPRLLLPRDLIAEHLAVHAYLRLRAGLSDDNMDFLILRHELLRVAANKRSGHKHSEQSTLNQRRHPSQLPPWMLQRLESIHLRTLTVYERWVYLRQRTDIELIDILFHAMMKKLPHVPQRKHPTPWHALGCKPAHYYHEGVAYEVLRGHQSRELARRP